ncbi:MAG TPA: diguanylate cyclase [Cellulomonas sp.]|uniref:histidine kinase N-terminal 7TM domain-containing diguanylate cyclase n=1 Tax=Cellulomonas sp. TaxID=40001 RepID=UPI002E302769|nr:diguanylate cyclase [Cellulomonas sp.]HEX5332873.1 diguanylate cyclase [Cellulomonas sp.]
MLDAVHVAAYVAAAVLLLHVGSGIWTRRAERPVASMSLVVIVAGAAWWSLADAVIATGVDGPVSGIAAAAAFPAIGAIVAAFLCLARSASSTDWVPTRRLLAMLAVEPLVVTVLVATNPLHQQFYGGPGAATLSTPNEWQHGPLFWVHTAYSYGLVVTALVLVALGWWRSPGVFGRQFRSLLVASLAPILVVVVDLVGKAGDFGDPTPLGLAVTAVVLHHSIRRQDLIGLAPIARQALFERVSDLVVAISPRGQVIDANPAAQALWHDATRGVGGSLAGQPANEILRALRAEPADLSMAAVLDGDDGAAVDITIDVAGTRADLEIRASRLTNRRGHSIGWVLVGRDVTEVNARNRQLLSQLDLIEGLHLDLAEQASRDPLTHLHNRRHGMEWLAPSLAGTAAGDVVCVLMIDVDLFKLVNDRYGHVVGDAVLVAMSRRLLKTMPADALIARWGGDEFVVALPATDASVGAACAEELRALCESEALTDRGLNVRWTLSVGVAASPESGRTAPELLEAADLALYAAKVAGRNRVCRHEPGVPVPSEPGRPDTSTSASDPAR